MSNKPGPQPKIKHCPACKSELKNVPRKQMKSRYHRRDGTIAAYTHPIAVLAGLAAIITALLLVNPVSKIGKRDSVHNLRTGKKGE